VGDLYEAACSHCGYGEVGLQDGAGLIGTFFEPMACHSCRELVSVVTADLYSPIGPGLDSCPQCGGNRLSPLPKLSLDERAFAEGFRLSHEARCPACGGKMAIRPAGRWGALPQDTESKH
jgi:rRNA maturation protein Nop10